MYHGQNYPWILSRFERAVNTISSLNAFLHSTNDQVTRQVRRESSEYLDQLTNRELVFDSRRKLTLFNGARNDLMPPWLWWRWEVPTTIGSVAAGPNFLAQARTKLDLREPDGINLLDGERSFAKRLAPSLHFSRRNEEGDENRASQNPHAHPAAPCTGDGNRFDQADHTGAGGEAQRSGQRQSITARHVEDHGRRGTGQYHAPHEPATTPPPTAHRRTGRGQPQQHAERKRCGPAQGAGVETRPPVAQRQLPVR